MWLQTLLYPASCLSVRMEIHQAPGVDRFSLAYEVSDPHTKELLATFVNPTTRYDAGVTLAAQVANDLRMVLLFLTDPEPF